MELPKAIEKRGNNATNILKKTSILNPEKNIWYIKCLISIRNVETLVFLLATITENLL